ncbi:MAG: AAA family ATPase [Ilumatobacter sp.]|nr:AAA family ATPase [Ilumatobacter sp.]
MTTQKELIDKAVEWAENGIPVFPCNINKAPLTDNGFYDAVSDPNKVRALFEFYGDAAVMIGGRMGDGIFAVDADLYKGAHVESWLKEKRDEGALVETRTHKTKSGGLHLLYEGEAGCSAPVPGVEIKGDGGYIILPGTPGYEVIREGVAEAPMPLYDVIKQATAAMKGSTKSQLEANILSGNDFHGSLTQLSAKLAFAGADQIQIQTRLLELLEASTAKSPGHSRHSRWLSVMQDKGGELSRIAASAYRKYNDEAAMEDAREGLSLGDNEALAAALFTSLGDFEPDTPPPPKEYADDEWPFEHGYFAHEDHDLATQRFTLYPIFAENESVVLFAEPKTGKTAIALTTALHIACGFDLGAFKVSEAGPSLYYALEGTRAIRLRVAAWKKRKREEGIDVPDKIPLFVVEGHANFLKEEMRKDEANKIIAANKYCIKNGNGPLKVVYLDTLTKAMSGGDQNSVEDTSHLFALIGELRAGGVTATVVFVHHKARAGHARGSSNIEAEPDVLLDVSKKGGTAVLRIARARSIEDGARFHFGLVGVDLGETEQGHPLAGVYAEPLEEHVEQGTDDYAEAKQLGERRKVVVEHGTGGVERIVATWHTLGLIEGAKVRGADTAPTPKAEHVQAALKEIAPEAAGAIYGDHLIRCSRDDQGNIVAFEVMGVAH